MGSHAGMNTSDLERAANNMILTPIHHSSPGACLHCYRLASAELQLLRCSQCQLVAYCSKLCQKKHWRNHKAFCKLNAVKDGKNIFSTKEESVTLFNFATSRIEYLANKLNRPLKQYEQDIMYFPRICRNCCESDYNLLTICDKCFSVFYCSETCQEQNQETHEKWCSKYVLNLMCDSYEVKEGIQDLPLPQSIDQTYVPLTGDLLSYLRPQLMPNNTSLIDYEVEYIIYERLSYSLSLLFALQRIFTDADGKSLSKLTNLNIHIVGATSLNEMLGLIRWEYVLHRLPVLNNLHAVFIGPELFKDVDTDEEFTSDKHGLDDSGLTRCSDCQSNDKMVIYEMANMTYHEFADSDRYSKPDFIIAFNPCFEKSNKQGQNTWRQTIEVILDSNEIPFAFTSYTNDDAETDLKYITNVSTQYSILFATEKNPFCSLRPIRDPALKDGCDLYYCNQYITSLKGVK